MTNSKKTMFSATMIVAAFLLQACQPTVPTYFQEVDVIATQAQSTAATTTQACNSGTLQWMIGQPEGVIAGVELVGPVRVISYNQTVSMDHNPTRTNYYLDTAGRITRVTCG
ncbi:hypothetical protein A9Q96_02185 [Rhodobacterales bacterium 52_120_T64]|nr:hypothetical protein A9Q96_02185 [Rhodobacterales bacterium 52_120_T64]